MYTLNTIQMAQIMALLGEGRDKQEPVFAAVDFNPYDDDGVGGYESIVMESERYENERKERISCPLDYGICETSKRAEEIKAGATLSKTEEQVLNENIFEGDDTLMVITELSDGADKVQAVTIQQIWGQAGLQVIDFLGFFASYEDARKVIQAADYVTFEEG